MNPAKLLYIDRHGISVTRFTLKVNKNSYPVKTIDYRCVELKLTKLRLLSVLIIGLVLSATGYVNAAGTINFDLSTLTLYVGIVALCLGTLAFALTQKRYALQISSPKGVKNSIVRRKKESILKIVQALDAATALTTSFKKEDPKAA